MLLFNEQFFYVSWIRIYLLEKLSPNLKQNFLFKWELEYLEQKRLTQMGTSPRTHTSNVFTKPELMWKDFNQ